MVVRIKGNVLGIIPARGGSKGISRKNIKLLLGKPLLAWSIDVAEVIRFLISDKSAYITGQNIVVD